jgi:hypothetical protein
MQKRSDNDNPPGPRIGKEQILNPEGYPLYADADDIYNRSKEEQDVDPDDTFRTKELNDDDGYSGRNEKDFDEDESGDDLDVPGSELDDYRESIGNEDEENNYYSLGGDGHNDLDEDRGE